jgi:hypothetical protein
MTAQSDDRPPFANKPAALLLGAMVFIAALGPAFAEGERPGTTRGLSLPIGMTGPATHSSDRLHTVPRLPLGSDDRAGAPARVDQGGPALPSTPDAGIVSVRH